MSLNDNTEEAMVLGITIGEDMVAVTYMEARDMGDGAMVQKTIMIDPGQVEEALQNVEAALRDLIDEGLLVIRKPASKLSRTAAMLKGEDS